MQCLCAGLDKKATSKVRIFIIDSHFSVEHMKNLQQSREKKTLFLASQCGNILVTCHLRKSLLELPFSSVFYATVTRVENTSTTSEAQALGPEISKQTTQPSQLEARSCPGIEERVRNMETHLGYGPGTD